MANADAFQSGFGIGKDAAGKGTKPGDRFGIFNKPASPKTYKKGGKVKKTGIALVHKGEEVLTKAQSKKYRSKGTRKRISKG